jgi:hypothetical protein
LAQIGSNKRGNGIRRAFAIETDYKVVWFGGNIHRGNGIRRAFAIETYCRAKLIVSLNRVEMG